MQKAVTEGWALAAFNVPSFDAMRGVAEAARAEAAPAILQISSRLVRAEGTLAVKRQFELACELSRAELYLHLDHCSEEPLIVECIEAGWDMVMFDGSHLPIEENARRSAALVEIAHGAGCAVEAEVGAIGGEEDGREAEANHAHTEDIRILAHETGIDCIAVGFGNVHGDYADKTVLRWRIFEDARDVASLPLVLHGGSGLTEAEFRRAIAAGAAKINISTELKKAYGSVLRDKDLAQTVSRSPNALHDEIRACVGAVARKYISMFRR